MACRLSFQNSRFGGMKGMTNVNLPVNRRHHPPACAAVHLTCKLYDMKMFITEEAIIRSIQQEFREAWPHLKIEFYKNPHASYEGSPAKEQLHGDTAIEDIRNIHTSGWINISGDVQVKTLEKQFCRLLGLNVQVFRKSGGVWLATTTTDHWTLAEQEEAAKASCS